MSVPRIVAMSVEMIAMSRLLPTASARPGRPNGFSQASSEKPRHARLDRPGGSLKLNSDHDQRPAGQVERPRTGVDAAAASGPRTAMRRRPAGASLLGQRRAVAAAHQSRELLGAEHPGVDEDARSRIAAIRMNDSAAAVG